jgi:hypothetical protein
MPEPLVLQGHSVRLVPLSLEHVEALVTAANGSRATYRFTWVPDDHPSMRTYVALAQSEQQAGRELPFTTCEIGATWLAASAQRTSINTEAKLLMLGHAFDVWQVHRVVFKTDARNSRSRAAIERIGGQFEGIRRAHKLASDGTIRDSAYFSILRSDWPEVNDHLTAVLVARLPAPS